ncbi:L-lactate dehydrogenase [Pseudanabaena sp. FACHB-2040]|uniref:L-lactate dehydrogenase n=1 Tax=Pseudanabaena sp. FACHB-2040 TaxID=2692859 RepID=UPI0016870EDB|nr:L-lactate dehydrogenase [Pseudanabaena sp. FACHB-2040]MBD2256077.1 L-lactate dehydrogenase [Pseudanabaena sp. FACHB-2040]
MFDTLFINNPVPDLKVDPLRPLKGVIVGAGQVGMACAYSLLIQNVFDEMVLVDINREKLEGEVMDLEQGMPFVEPTTIKAGTMADGAGADIVIVTAGAAQKPGETRLDLVQKNVEILKKLIPDIVSHAPDAILLMVSNPVDVLTYAAWKLSGLPRARVLGSGTVLDTGRFRYLLARKLQIDSRSLHAYVIGEHGDSEVPFWSQTNVAGARLYYDGMPDADRQAMDDVFNQTKNAAYEIIQRKGYTSYAIGLAVTQIVQAIVRDQNRVLTVSSLLDDISGVKDLCLSLPAVVNRMGVTRVLKLPLSESEQTQLCASARTLRDVIDQIRF